MSDDPAPDETADRMDALHAKLVAGEFTVAAPSAPIADPLAEILARLDAIELTVGIRRG